MKQLRIVAHRVNTLGALAKVPKGYGVEIDVRSAKGQLILAHDPYRKGVALKTFLAALARQDRSRLLVVNVKEEGHEEEILSLLKRFRLSSFFFLDVAMPTLVRLACRKKMRQVAVRVSEWESVEAAMTFRRWVKWVWVDSFSGRPPSRSVLQRLRRSFKICLVSPELQGYPLTFIERFRHLAKWLDAVCTDRPEKWLRT